MEGQFLENIQYRLVCNVLNLVGEPDLLDSELRRRIEDGIDYRRRQVAKVKPIMSDKLRFSMGGVQ